MCLAANMRKQEMIYLLVVGCILRRTFSIMLRCQNGSSYTPLLALCMSCHLEFGHNHVSCRFELQVRTPDATMKPRLDVESHKHIVLVDKVE